MEQQQNPNQDTVVLAINSDIALEGIEMALVEYQCKDEKEDLWGFTLKTQKNVSFPPDLRQQIIDTIKFYATQPTNKFDDDKFNAVDKKIGEFVTKQVEEFENYNSASLIAFNPILIHLIVRENSKPKSAMFCAKFCVDLAQKIKIRVVSNFFAYDFFLRGNGGPYHCIGQAKLFPKQQYQINLSGYASVTSYKPIVELNAENKIIEDKNKEENKFAEADGYFGEFVYPAMLAINYASGKWDSSQQYELGNLNPEFEKQITSVRYPYTTKAIAELMQKIDSSSISKPDKVATLCSIISKQFKEVIQELKWQKKEVYLVGTHSQTLNQAVSKELESEVQILKASEHQETIILGFIGLRKNKTLLNVFKGATNSLSNHCSGIVHIPTDKPLVIGKSPNLQTLQQFQQHDKKEQRQKLENSEDFNNEIIPLNDQPQLLKSATLRHQTQSLKK